MGEADERMTLLDWIEAGYYCLLILIVLQETSHLLWSTRFWFCVSRGLYACNRVIGQAALSAEQQYWKAVP